MHIKILNKRLCYLITGAIAIVFSGCLKDPGIEQIGVQLRFTNVSPDAGSIQFKLNGENSNSTGLAFNDTTNYLSVKGGTYNVSVEAGGKTPVNTVIDFVPKANYSLFLIDSASRATLKVYKDDLTEPGIPLRMKIRFFNFVPNASSLSLYGISSSDTTAFAVSVGFNASADVSNQQFNIFPSNQYQLVLVSGNTIVGRLAATTFINSKIYTVYARGVLGVAGSRAPTLSIIQHN